MSNEPVAWMYKTTYKNETEIDVISDEFKQSGKGGDCSEYSIPLYTHPVKELTDEEVFNLEQQAYNLAMQVQNQKALIKQLEETQVYLYKTHDADKAEIEALKEQLRFSYDGQ